MDNVHHIALMLGSFLLQVTLELLYCIHRVSISPWSVPRYCVRSGRVPGYCVTQDMYLGVIG
jgi:hypothetical protein